MLELFGIFSPEDLTLLVDRELEIGDQDLELCWRKVTCRKTEKKLSFNMKQSTLADFGHDLPRRTFSVDILSAKVSVSSLL